MQRYKHIQAHVYIHTYIHVAHQHVYPVQTSLLQIDNILHHVYMHTCKRTCTYIHTYTHTHVANQHVYPFQKSLLQICENMPHKANMHTYKQMYVHTYTHTHTYIHAHIPVANQHVYPVRVSLLQIKNMLHKADVSMALVYSIAAENKLCVCMSWYVCVCV